jgi:hypothetical protein
VAKFRRSNGKLPSAQSDGYADRYAWYVPGQGGVHIVDQIEGDGADPYLKSELS